MSPQEAWAIIGPGGRLHPGWFLEHKGHLVVEGLLIVIIAVMLLQSRFSPKATEDEEGLTEKVCCTASAPSSKQQTELPATGWRPPGAHCGSQHHPQPVFCDNCRRLTRSVKSGSRRLWCLTLTRRTSAQTRLSSQGLSAQLRLACVCVWGGGVARTHACMHTPRQRSSLPTSIAFGAVPVKGT